MLYSWGLGIYKFRWTVIAIWAIILLAALPLGRLVTSELSNGFGRLDTEAQHGVDVLDEVMGFTKSSITVVFRSDTYTYLDEIFRVEVEDVLGNLIASEEAATGFVSPYNSGDPFMVSEDGHTIYTLIYLDTSVDEAMDMMPELRSKLLPTELELWTTGGIPIFYDMNIVSESDLRRGEMVAFPIIMLVLILVFGSLVAAGLPMIIGAVSIIVTSALIFLLTQITDISIFVLNIATLLGLGVAIDYSLLFINRFREEIDVHAIDESVAVTMSTAGKSIMFSAITSLIGLSGLLLFDFMMLRSLGIGGVTVMLLSLLVSMTLLPAMVSVIGTKINAIRIMPAMNIVSNFWHGLARWVMRHPLPVVLPLTIFLLLLGTPFLRANLGAPWASILPDHVESRQGFDILNQDIGHGEGSPILIVYESSTSVLSADNIQTMYEMTQRLSGDPAVRRIESIFSIIPGLTLEQYKNSFVDMVGTDPQLTAVFNNMATNTATFIKVIPVNEIMHDETKDLVNRIRSVSIRGDLNQYVTGGTADLMDSIEVIYSSFPLVIMYVLLTIYVALFLLFKSVVLPLKAVIMNSISIFATFGALVFIFQEGHLKGLLGFETMGYIDAMMPVVLFCITFGISMDYEVFLLSRVKEVYDQTGDNALSVAVGLERTGRIITSAALVMILVCGSFALADIVIVKMFGVGLGLAILIDATLVRALIVPALMRIMGRFNWWSPWSKNRDLNKLMS